MNRIIIDFPSGTNLRIAIITSTAAAQEVFVASAPVRIRLDEDHAIVDSPPMEDPSDNDSDNSDGSGENQADQHNGTIDLVSDSEGENSMEMEDSGSSTSEDNNTDLVYISQIRI